MKLESHTTANGFCIVTKQLFPHPECNLTSAETHKSAT